MQGDVSSGAVLYPMLDPGALLRIRNLMLISKRLACHSEHVTSTIGHGLA